jgi:hypothetical protein
LTSRSARCESRTSSTKGGDPAAERLAKLDTEHKQGELMRKLAVLILAAALALVIAGTSSGQQVQQVPISLNDHFQDEGLSELCGVDVFIDVVADLKVTLVYNQRGLVVREIDRAGGGTITFSSPDTGKSFSFPFQPSQWDYGSGAAIGSPVIVSFTGLFGHVPGLIPSDAGLFRFLGVVTGFDEFGIPEVDFVEVIVDRGNRESGERIGAAICSALTDP